MKSSGFWKSPLLNLAAKAGDSLTTYLALTKYPNLCREVNPICKELMSEMGLLETLLFTNLTYTGFFLLSSLAVYKYLVKQDGERVAKKYYDRYNLLGAVLPVFATLFNINTLIQAHNYVS